MSNLNKFLEDQIKDLEKTIKNEKQERLVLKRKNMTDAQLAWFEQALLKLKGGQ